MPTISNSSTAYLVQLNAIIPIESDINLQPGDKVMMVYFLIGKAVWTEPSNVLGQHPSAGVHHLICVEPSAKHPFEHPRVAWSISDAIKLLEYSTKERIAYLQFSSAAAGNPQRIARLKARDYQKILASAQSCAGINTTPETYISPFTGKRV